MSEPPYTIVRVTAWELRGRFNAGRYWERAQAGELTIDVFRDKPLPPGHETGCARTQTASYLDADGQEVARVHQYIRADGSIGGSGKPDPKRLREGSVMYRLETREE